MGGREFGLKCQKLASGFDNLRVGRLREVYSCDGMLHDGLSCLLFPVLLDIFQLSLGKPEGVVGRRVFTLIEKAGEDILKGFSI